MESISINTKPSHFSLEIISVGSMPERVFDTGIYRTPCMENMKINDQLVSSVMWDIGAGATIAKYEKKWIRFHFTPNSNGQYEIEIKANELL